MELSPTKKALLALKKMQSKLETLENAKHEPIAVVGMDCRFPGANNPEEFWQLLEEGKDAIKRVIKFVQMGWYRIKRKVGGEPVPEFYTRKVKELEKLIQLEKVGKIEIRYVDETGFCLIPYLPYAWQEKKQKIEVKSQQSKRLNVLGFLTRQNELEVYTFQCSINSDVVIACVDKFCEKLTKKTVLIMDNSSIHQNSF